MDRGDHFSSARAISNRGAENLPLNLESITGYTIIQAASLDEAEKITAANPLIANIRVYEIRSE